LRLSHGDSNWDVVSVFRWTRLLPRDWLFSFDFFHVFDVL